MTRKTENPPQGEATSVDNPLQEGATSMTLDQYVTQGQVLIHLIDRTRQLEWFFSAVTRGQQILTKSGQLKLCVGEVDVAR